jgi:hypothetical protein
MEKCAAALLEYRTVYYQCCVTCDVLAAHCDWYIKKVLGIASLYYLLVIAVAHAKCNSRVERMNTTTGQQYQQQQQKKATCSEAELYAEYFYLYGNARAYWRPLHRPFARLDLYHSEK